MNTTDLIGCDYTVSLKQSIDDFYIKTTADYPIIKVCANDLKEVMRIERDGRIYWNGREIESDDDFKAAMMDVHKVLCGQRC